MCDMTAIGISKHLVCYVAIFLLVSIESSKSADVNGIEDDLKWEAILGNSSEVILPIGQKHEFNVTLKISASSTWATRIESDSQNIRVSHSLHRIDDEFWIVKCIVIPVNLGSANINLRIFRENGMEVGKMQVIQKFNVQRRSVMGPDRLSKLHKIVVLLLFITNFIIGSALDFKKSKMILKQPNRLTFTFLLNIIMLPVVSEFSEILMDENHQFVNSN